MLPIEAFRPHPKGKDGYYPWCKECHHRKKRQWAEANPERYRAMRRRERIRKYGISSDQYLVLLAAQGGVCAICGAPPTDTRKRLQIDHDHRTGEVRGLLCHHCNRALGHIRDDPARAEALARYLRHSPAARVLSERNLTEPQQLALRLASEELPA